MRLYQYVHPSLILLYGMIALTGLAQSVVNGQDAKVTSNNDGGKNTRTIELTVSAAKEAQPAFRYRLTVPPDETIPGNAITHYLRSDGEGGLRPLDTARKRYGDVIYDWSGLEMPADEIDMAAIRQVCESLDYFISNHIRRATICREADWGYALESLRGEETFSFPLPSVQQTRNISRVLAMRTRLDVIEGKFDDAVNHLRMNYTLGRNVNELGLLVSSLVGIAEVGISNLGMKHLISAEDSPNMYWALGSLPEPVIDLRWSATYEAGFARRLFTELDGVETAKLSEEQWTERLNETVARFLSTMQFVSPGKSSTSSDQAATMGIVMLTYGPAKKRLIAKGMDKAKVESLPVAQVILIDTQRELERYSQDTEKVFCIPYHQMKAIYEKAEQDMRHNRMKSFGAMIGGAILPATAQVRQAQTRIQAEVNVLMLIESLRNHLATKGSFPKSLNELELPVRNDPYTGKPFKYQLQDGLAVVEHGMGSPLRYKYILKAR